MKARFLILPFPLLLLFISACKEKKESNIDAYYENTKKVRLTREYASLKIPLIFNRSSPSRLRAEVVHFQKDSFALSMAEKKLQDLQFTDSDIDIFVDTLKRDHFFFIVDMPYIPIDKGAGRVLNGIITTEYKGINQSELNLYAKRIQSSFKKGKNYSYYKCKYKLTDLSEQYLDFFQTIYFLSSRKKTYMITENSARQEDIENYLWTWKED